MAEEISTFLKQALDELSIHRESKVCIISMVSKSPLGENLSKVALLNQLVEKQMFTSYASMKKIDNCSIEVFFDADNQCIFLNFQSPYELNSFEFRRTESENYHQWWVDKEKQVVAHLLYLFSISQIVLFHQPTCRFDLSYLRLFRNLNYLREKCLTSVQDILSDITSVPKGWSKEGRAGCPRVLFLFSRPPSFMKPDGTVETRKGSYKKLAACLEDQIFRLFRKSRIVTNNSSISICSLPSKQSFCYIFGPNEEPKEFGREILSNLSCSDDKKNEYEDYGFKNFFFDHVDLAFSSGFDDNAVKVGPAYFELPKLKNFVRVASALYDFYVKRYKENEILSEIDSLVDVVTKFSENRCNKAYPMALANYQDRLPLFYNEIQHRAKVMQSLQILRQQARGPCLEKAVEKLAQECEAYWQNGRKACEVYSLTGNVCSNQLHRVSGKELGLEHLPLMWHSSKVRYLSTCNCGRRQAWRDDPFEIYEANYAFYELNKDFSCCDRLEKLDAPVYVRKRKIKTKSSSEEEESKENIGKYVPAPRLRKISVEQLFENLRLGMAATQEETKNTNPTRDDFLPDRDNRPSSVKLSTSSPRRESPGKVDAQDNEEERMKEAMNGGENLERSLSQGLLDDSGLLFGNRNFQTVKVNTQDDTDMILPDRDNFLSSSLRNMPGTGSQLSELLRNNALDDQVLSSSLLSPANENIDKKDEQTDVVIEDDRNVANISDQEENSLLRDDLAPETTENHSDHKLWEKESEEIGQWTNEEEIEYEEADDDGIYLPGMVHSLCQPGLLPLFPSWTLICIGHSSIYSHSSGLRDSPNFTHGSSYLLPWDVTLPSVDLERWHDLMEAMILSSKRAAPYKKPRLPLHKSIVPLRPQQSPLSMNSSLTSKDGSVSVKVFVGYEYECPRGHRFMMQLPDRMLKHASSTGGPKDSGADIVLKDMPLWAPCNCKQTHGQLTRLHVITPKAPVLVVLNPKVQPRANAPFFSPGFLTPPRLGPAQYWILRLPFVYVGPEGSFYPPKEGYHPYGRILKSSISVIADL